MSCTELSIINGVAKRDKRTIFVLQELFALEYLQTFNNPEASSMMKHQF